MPDSEPTDDNNDAHRVELRIVARADKKDVERHKADDELPISGKHGPRLVSM